MYVYRDTLTYRRMCSRKPIQNNLCEVVHDQPIQILKLYAFIILNTIRFIDMTKIMLTGCDGACL